MSYAGNSSLAPEIQQRILNTFRQTQDLAAQGSTQEAALGCDFILRMDPAFRPARELLAALKAGTTPPAFDAALGDAEAGNETVRMPAVKSPPAAELKPAAPAPPSEGGVLAAALTDLLERRELRRLVQAAEENRAEVAQNPALRKLVETAYARLEAEPYIKNYLDSARAALEVGDFEECDRLLAKARSLDPTAPGIEELAEERRGYDAPGDAFGGNLPGYLTKPRPAANTPAADLDFFAEVPAVDDGIVRHDVPPEVFGADFGAHATGGDERVQELLREGQQAFDRGQFQEAIDCWSRIFLIDIDHEEAARRIEDARRRRSEGDRQVEEVFHQGVSAYEIGEPEQARLAFQKVLAIAPGHLGAREYLGQLGDGPTASPVDLEALNVFPGPAGAAPAPDSQPLVPPPPGATPARPAITRPRVTVSPRPSASKAPTKSGGSHRNFLLIGTAALALLLAVGGFVWMKRDQFFPNFGAASEKQGPNPLDRAKKQYDAGKIDVAIKVLRAVPEDDPRYTEAQTLATSWELELNQKQAADAKASVQADPALAARRDRLLAKARESAAQGENLLADAYFRAVAKDQLLSPADQQLATEAALKLDPLRREIELMRQQDWASVLPDLWRKREAGGASRDLDRLIFNCYYNLAVRDLQGGEVEVAVGRLDQALKLLPREITVTRIRAFAQTYTKRPRDLLYRIYVGHLPIL